MGLRPRLAKAASAAIIAGACGMLPTPGARAEGAVDADAQAVLGRMSTYLGSLPRFSVAFAAADEVVTSDGQKLQFLHSGEITAQRPDHLFIIRKGAAGTSEVFLGGGKLTLYAKDAGAYLQLPATSIDAAIRAVHKLGFEAPGADFLDSKPLDASSMDITSGTHVGMTFIDGVEVHQLAFRGAEVDWQLWVTAGDKPLPLRYVVTTKALGGAPQYTLQLRNWNTAPKVDAARFAFVPPPGARQLDPAAVSVNAIGDMTIRKE